MSINNTLQPTSAHADSDGYRRYHIVPTGYGASSAGNSVISEYVGDSAAVFDDEDMPGAQNVRSIVVDRRAYKYVQWGMDDQRPYLVRKQLLSNMVTAQCQQFNVVSCYGQGVRFVDRKDKRMLTTKRSSTSACVTLFRRSFLSKPPI